MRKMDVQIGGNATRYGALIMACALLTALPARAQTTYTWQQGGNNSNWGSASNWGGSVVFNNRNTFVFYQNATRLNNFLGDDRVIGTLHFHPRAARDVTIRLATTARGTVSVTMNFSGSEPTISVARGAEGNFTIGEDQIGRVSFRNADLTVAHNGSGELRILAQLGGSGGTDRGLIKHGTGVLVLGGDCTYRGDTTIHAGTLSLVEGGSMAFKIGQAGKNTRVIGAGGAARFNGEFVFDLTDASQTAGSSWTIVHAADGFDATYGDDFSVNSFINRGSGVWIRPIDSERAYQFTQSTGILTVVAN